MAVYIDDSGSYIQDAEFIGVEDTAWSRNSTDRAIWFSSTGTCTTGFTLPDSEWIVYEVYGMTGTSLTADYTTLTGSTQLHGKKEYTTTIGTVLTTLNAWRTALDKTNYTTYEIIATHYKGSDLADVYEADETTAFSTASITDGDFTDHSSEWVIKDTLLADLVIANVIPNGYFDNGTTDWATDANCGVTVTDGTATVTNTGSYGQFYTENGFTTEIGETYTLAYQVSYQSTTSIRYTKVGFEVDSNSVDEWNENTTGSFSHTFVAATTTTYVTLANGSDITNSVDIEYITAIKV